jgi:peptidoglycan/xylan/chitin deacetylase (PgdA/CDA1 family)
MDDKRPQHAKRCLKNFLREMIGFFFLCIGKPGIKSFPLVFVVHDVSDLPFTHSLLTNSYCSQRVFLEQLGFLRRTFDFICMKLEDLRLPKSGCLITFDDGYSSSMEVTEKLFIENQIQSIHFWNSNTLMTGINFSSIEHLASLNERRLADWSNSTPRLKIPEEGIPDKFAGPYLTLEQAKSFSARDYVLIGDHGVEHFYSPALTNTELRANLSFAKVKMNSDVNPLPLWAAPHSAINDEVVDVLNRAGYKTIFGGKQYFQYKDTQVVPRIDLNESLDSKFSILGAIAITLSRHYFMSLGNKKESISFRD